jgi:hypothetical protein
MKVSYLLFDAEDGGDISLRNFVRPCIPEEHDRHISCYLYVFNVFLFIAFGCPLLAPREPKECVKLVDHEILIHILVYLSFVQTFVPDGA